jgi:hypothetical protein
MRLMIVTVKDNQNVFDLVTQYYGGLDGLDQFLQDNPSVVLDADIVKGTDVVIDETIMVDNLVFGMLQGTSVIIATGDKSQFRDHDFGTTTKTPSGTIITPIPLYAIKDNQNPFDLAIQHYGGMEGLEALLVDNPTVRPDVEVIKGTALIIDSSKVVNKSMMDYIEQNALVIATGSTAVNTGDFWIMETGDNVINESDTLINV